MKLSGIYKIVNRVNGKYYIGSSVNIKSRWKSHKVLLRKKRHNNPHLISAWHKYGENNFEFSIIQEVSESNLMIEEQKYLDIAKLEQDRCYNLSFKAYKIDWTDKMKQAASIRMSGEKHPLYGKTRTDEVKEKIRLHNLSVNNTWRGRSHSKSTLDNHFFGSNNPNYDTTKYTFIHKKTGEIFIGERQQLARKLGVNSGNINNLINECRKSAYGWIVSKP